MPFLETSRDFIAGFLNSYEDMVHALSAFRRLAEGLSGKLTVNGICRKVPKMLVEELHLEKCSIMLMDSATGTLVFKSASGSPYGSKLHLQKRSFKLGEGVAGLAAKTKRPILIKDVNKDPRFLHLDSSVKIGSMLSIPLITGEEILGVINMSHPEKNYFNSRYEDVFGILSMFLGHLIVAAKMKEYLKGKVKDRTQELEASKTYLESIINNVNDLILTVSRNGVVTFINGRIMDFNIVPEKICGRPYHNFTVQKVSPFVLRQLIREGRASWSVDTKYKKKDKRTFSCNISTLRNSAGRITSFLVVARDVTEKKKMEDSMAMMSRLSSLGEMSAGIAHELNNRLVPILSYSEMLLEGGYDERTKRMLESICNSAVGCKEIINALLDFARQRELKKSLVDINAVINNTLAFFRYKLDSTGISIKKELASSLPFVMADPLQMEQVFINIINNAVHSMERGGQLTVKTKRSDNKLIVEIGDTGCGISEKSLNKIFDPFFTTKGIGKGTGLGLSLSYGIVKSHRGKISVSSSIGKGTTFTIELPGVEDTGRRLSVSEVDKNSKYKNSGHKGASVLVIDDEATVCDVIKEMLETEGFDVQVASDAENALKLIDTNAFDLILSDIRMPRIDGRELYRTVVKRHPELKDRIIFITGDIVSYDIGDLREFLDDSGCSYLTKPFKAAEVVEAVTRILNR